MAVELEGERDHLQRILMKHKEEKDLWLKTDLENGEEMKLFSRNLDKAERRQAYLTKELDETLDHLHVAQHKVLSHEVDTGVAKSEVADLKEKVAQLEAENDLLRQGGAAGEESSRGGTPRALSPTPGAQEPIAFHLYGGEEQKKRLEEKQKHVVSLERELRRTREQLKAIRAQEAVLLKKMQASLCMHRVQTCAWRHGCLLASAGQAISTSSV